MPAPPEPSDLRRRLRQGDPSALAVLLERFWGPVSRFLSRFLDDADGIDDVAQECFVRLWNTRRRLEASGSLTALIFRIARNAALDARRREAARERSRLGLIPARTPPADERLELDDLQRVADRALRALPARRREVFLLLRETDLSHREVAELLGISPQTVSNLMSLALRELRQAMDRHLSARS